VPGRPGPHDDFVRNLLEQIERMGKDAAVTVELADGSLFHLIAILARPGFGFITLQPHPEGEEPTEIVVPVASITQIRIGHAEPHQRVGFALPAEKPA
jgi:hypothetical protein